MNWDAVKARSKELEAYWAEAVGPWPPRESQESNASDWGTWRPPCYDCSGVFKYGDGPIEAASVAGCPWPHWMKVASVVRALQGSYVMASRADGGKGWEVSL